MKFLGFFILIFLFVYGPVFNSVGAWADTIFLLSVVIVFCSTAFPKPIVPGYANMFLILFPLFFCIGGIALFYPGIKVLEVVMIVIRPLRILFMVISGYTIVRLIHRYYPESLSAVIFELVFLSIVLHAGIMLGQFFFPDFKDMVYKYTSNGDFRGSFDYNFRMGGLSGGTGGAILSVVQSTGIILLPFLNRTLSKTKKILYTFFTLLILFSILVCGRSGLWSTILFTPIALFLSSSKLNGKVFFKFGIVVIVLLFLVSGLLVYMQSLGGSNPLFLALSRTLDTFVNYQESGEFNDGTTSVLMTHILLPTDIVTFLIGDTDHLVNAQFGRALDSDIGYIRNIWGFGFIGAIVFVIPMLRVVFLLHKDKRKYLSAGYLLLLTFVMLFFHLKENFLYTRMLFSVYVLVFAVFYFDKLANKERL